MQVRQVVGVVLIAALLAVACVTVPETPQGVVNEARANLIAAVRLNRSYMAEGIITPAVHDQRLAQIEKISQDLKEAEKLIEQGMAALAMDRAKLARTGILALRAALEKEAKR